MTASFQRLADTMALACARSRPFAAIATYGIALLLVASSPPVAHAGSLEGPDGAWSTPFVHPSNNEFINAIYDPVGKRKIVFGGYGQSLDVVWSLSLDEPTMWSLEMATGELPSSRYGASVVYDPVRHRILLFGGETGVDPGGSPSSEVWALSLTGAPSWSRVDVANGPPRARTQHVAIYDPVGDRMIIHGGHVADLQQTSLADAWALDLGTLEWSEIVTSGPKPAARNEHAATYDPVANRMVVFGGETTNDVPTFPFNDTWGLSLSGDPAWISIAAPGPLGRNGHSLLHDIANDQMVLVGGWGPHALGGYGDQHVVWVLPRGGSWSYLPFVGYIGSDRAPAIYDPDHQRIVAYSGRDPMDVPWADLGTLTWGRLVPRPIPHYGSAAVYDPVRDRLLVQGGRNQDSPMSDTWELVLSGVVRWSKLETQGEAQEKVRHSAIYDPLRDRMLLFGDEGYVDIVQVWEVALSGTPTWRSLGESGFGQLNSHVAIYDPIRDRMIIQGGGDRSTVDGQTWALSLADDVNWTQLPTGPSFFFHTAVYDPVGDRMLVFGGSEVWALSLSPPEAWSPIVPTGEVPPNYTGMRGAYDSVRRRVLLFGGCCEQDEDGDDLAVATVWELTLDGSPKWRRLDVGLGPFGRYGSNVVYDPVRDRLIVSGGEAPELFFPSTDVWMLDFPDAQTPTLVSSASGEFNDGLVLVRWTLHGLDGSAHVERRIAPGDEWRLLGVATHSGRDGLTFEDRDVQPGTAYDYRLLFLEGGVQHRAGEVRVEIPIASALALERAWRNGSSRALHLSFTLPSTARTTIECFDITGRRIVGRRWDAPAPGRHEIVIPEGAALRPGVYLVRVLQGGERAVLRFVIAS